MFSFKRPQTIGNDDYGGIDTVRGIFVVADEMGGRPGHARASRVAVGTFISKVASVDKEERLDPIVLHLAIPAAHRDVRVIPDEDPMLSGLGTTLSAVVVDRASGHVVHGGDAGRAFFETVDFRSSPWIIG